MNNVRSTTAKAINKVCLDKANLSLTREHYFLRGQNISLTIINGTASIIWQDLNQLM